MSTTLIQGMLMVSGNISTINGENVNFFIKKY